MNEKKKIQYRGVFRHYIRIPLYLMIILAALNVGVYLINIEAGLLVSVGILLCLLVATIIYNFQKKSVLNDLIAFANEYSGVEKKLLDDLQIPYAVLDTEGKLIWSNLEFCELTGKKQCYHKNIETLFPEISRNAFSEKRGSVSEVMVQYGDRIFRTVLKPVSIEEAVRSSDLLETGDGNQLVIGAFFYDETQLRKYIQQIDDEKAVFGLIYIDNYDEAFQSVEDVRRSLLGALIDRRIGRYFSNIDGLVRKLEKDKYMLVMKKSSLELLKEERFHILDEVKTVSIGNEMAITLSIGIGINAPEYLQNYEYARIAIEMALGRGGDQVVVKDGDNISYFGGKTPQVERNTRVKARVKAQALKEFMSSRDRIVVMGHKITDVDALGAAIGIYRAGRTIGKQVHIVVNDPTTSIKPLMAGFIDNPEYTPDMFIDSAAAQQLVDNNTVVIVVDTNKPSYTECQELLSLTKTIVVLDHHRRGSEVIQNAVLSYVEPYASSTCEMVSEILQYFADGLKLRSIEADCLYAGIIIDTNNFTTRAGVRTFEAAAFLKRSGADITRVRKLLRDNIDSYKARAEAVRSAEIYRDHFAIALCPSEGLESPTVVGAQAANELLNISDVKASFVLTCYNDEIYISARAIDEINVQVMMEKLGGGGHLNIAGAQMRTPVEEAKKELQRVIDETIEEAES